VIDLDWTAIGKSVSRQQRNRETHSPTISAYRWWARRSHALIGSLVEAAAKVYGDNLIISDPMSGGGTVAIEAARRGFTVVTQDINPWAQIGLSTIMEPVDVAALTHAGEQLLKSLAEMRPLYQFRIGGKTWTELVTLRVRATRCRSCRKKTFLFPQPIITLETRIDAKIAPNMAWYGCPACGDATRAGWPRTRVRCANCDETIRIDAVTNSVSSGWSCAHCERATAPSDVPLSLARAQWVSVLSQIERNGETRFVKAPRRRTRTSTLADRLRTRINHGTELNALINRGYLYWSDLFPRRQLSVLERAAQLVHRSRSIRAVKDRLLLAIVGAAEMAGHACRWDPNYLKPYEALANHHYSRTTFVAEVNLLSERGRGTLPGRIRQSVAAAMWFPGSGTATVNGGSSERQPIATASVSAVITDPPYFCDVRYGELSQLFIAVGRALGLRLSTSPDLRREAVPSNARREGLDAYRSILQGIMSETARTVSNNGRVILTFRHSEVRVWQALGDALRFAGLQIIAIAVAHAENETDFSKRTRSALVNDLIIECAKATSRPVNLRVCASARNKEMRNILAMGQAIAKYVDCGSLNLDDAYTAELRNLSTRRIFDPRGTHVV
jgi:adenine-specific DNA methylase